jgi:hypothetical protein
MVLIILRKNTCKIKFPNAEESARYNFNMLDSPNKKQFYRNIKLLTATTGNTILEHLKLEI